MTHINLSKNSIGYKYIEEQKVIEMKMKNQDKLKDFSFEQLFYDSLGLEHLTLALETSDRLRHLDLSENDIGPGNFKLLLRLFPRNTHVEYLNVADCKLDAQCAVDLCSILQQSNKSLRNLYFRNSKIRDEGALAVAELIKGNISMVELEVFNCGISERGGAAIGEALKTNFCIEKLSIGENILNKRDVEQIQQSVIFNTQYNQMKDSNRKFEGFAHNLIAESLKRWASQSNFVAAKLQERLQYPLDELDVKITEVMFDSQGHIDLKPVPTKYEYTSGDGQVQFSGAAAAKH